MASIKNSSRLIKRLTITNFLSEKGLTMTPLIVGQHGIGKTQSINQVAKDIGGVCLVIDGPGIGEKELPGLPYAAQASDGSTELRYIKHYIINTVSRMEKFYYEKALKEGFLNGQIKLEIDEKGNKILHEGKTTKIVETIEDRIFNGEENTFKFGEYLSPETKFKLVEAGEIKPIIILIDELNRTEIMIQKELMNIILNKNVSGYNLPWYVNFVAAINPSSQNSSYQTNEMDPAQLSRFLLLNTEADLSEWVDYALEKGLSTEVVEAIAMDENIFITKDSSLINTTKSTPDPRAWEMVNHILKTSEFVNNTKFFSNEEKSFLKDDISKLVIGKVGPDAGRVFMANLARRDSNIKPEEILTAKSPKINTEVLEKFKKLKRLTQKIISENVVRYILEKMDTVMTWKKSKVEEENAKYMNWKNQVKEFATSLDPTTQLIFARKLLEKAGIKSFNEVAGYFAKDVLLQITASKQAINDLNSEK